MDALFPQHAEAGLQQLQAFQAILDEQPDMRSLLENPSLAGDRRKSFLKQLAGELKLDPRVANFINLIVERNRLDIFKQILTSYQNLFDERTGIISAVVTAAQPLDASQQKQIEAKLQKLTGKKVRMEVSVDPSLIGGVVARVGGTIFDGSVRQQLEAFRNHLAQR